MASRIERFPNGTISGPPTDPMDHGGRATAGKTNRFIIWLLGSLASFALLEAEWALAVSGGLGLILTLCRSCLDRKPREGVPLHPSLNSDTRSNRWWATVYSTLRNMGRQQSTDGSPFLPQSASSLHTERLNGQGNTPRDFGPHPTFSKSREERPLIPQGAPLPHPQPLNRQGSSSLNRAPVGYEPPTTTPRSDRTAPIKRKATPYHNENKGGTKPSEAKGATSTPREERKGEEPSEAKGGDSRPKSYAAAASRNRFNGHSKPPSRERFK